MRYTIDNLDRNISELKKEFENIIIEKQRIKELQQRCSELGKLCHKKMEQFNNEDMAHWKRFYNEKGNMYVSFSNILIEIMNDSNFDVFSTLDIEKYYLQDKGE